MADFSAQLGAIGRWAAKQQSPRLYHGVSCRETNRAKPSLRLKFARVGSRPTSGRSDVAAGVSAYAVTSHSNV